MTLKMFLPKQHKCSRTIKENYKKKWEKIQEHSSHKNLISTAHTNGIDLQPIITLHEVNNKKNNAVTF